MTLMGVVVSTLGLEVNTSSKEQGRMDSARSLYGTHDELQLLLHSAFRDAPTTHTVKETQLTALPTPRNSHQAFHSSPS